MKRSRTYQSHAAEDAIRISSDDLTWTLGSLCALNRKPFDPKMLLQQFPAPHSSDVLIRAARGLGFRIEKRRLAPDQLQTLTLPCLALVSVASAQPEGQPVEEFQPAHRVSLVIRVTRSEVVLFPAGSDIAVTLTCLAFAERYEGTVFLFALDSLPVDDPDRLSRSPHPFGFRWFIPELLKHKRVWRDILISSLVIQLLALTTPLFTQVVIDKVVVHRTQNTLIAVALGMTICLLFTSLLGWIRQYLVLHTGNRVDAVLGAAVFDHVLKLPPKYFEQRATGVIAARLRGVEAIREFIAGTAVALCLDLPFLLIFVAIMFVYSWILTLASLSLIACIVLASVFVAPIFRARLNTQFLLGARNQAFTTEYIAGMETVKSLQLEPQLRERYGNYLAEYLRSGFGVRQIANTYNVFSSTVEQLMTLLILIIGAYLVMSGASFTIGMLVAFQMFSSRVSQPMLRLVGIWQQLQQARLSVDRLGDIMNVTPEPYSISPRRVHANRGLIQIEDLSFRHNNSLPPLYRGLNIRIEPGNLIALMGPSGSGKSTLAKILQGFYPPSTGVVKIDGVDIQLLAANELRHYFGVVPQETTLFSGTIFDNLWMAAPGASVEAVVHACKIAEIHTVIDSLPQGYQTVVGERGAGLSTGQKQRLAIARALLKQPRILIFDEATSSLDQLTSEHLCSTINQLKTKVTILFIAHALPRTLQVDGIIQVGGRSNAAMDGSSAEGRETLPTSA